MICTKCKIGGTANSAGDTRIAIMFHAECEYKDCYCQHKTGNYVKKQCYTLIIQGIKKAPHPIKDEGLESAAFQEQTQVSEIQTVSNLLLCLVHEARSVPLSVG